MTGNDGEGLSRFGTVFFIVCFGIVGYLLILIFRPFISTIVWAMVLAIVFWPLYRRLLGVTKSRRALAALAACLVILLLIVLPLTLVGVLVTQQAVALYHGIEARLDNSGGLLTTFYELETRPSMRWLINLAGLSGPGPARIEDAARQLLGAVSRWLVSRGPSLLAGVGGLISGFFLMFITMFFLFRDGPELVNFVKASNPLPAAYEEEILKKFEDVSYATFFGTILTAIVQGCAGGLLFFALGIASPLFWGAVIAFVSLVPMVGAFLVWVPTFIYLQASGHATKAVLLLAIGGLVISSIDNVLKPIIIKGRTDMHPLLVFFSVLGGMQVFGFLGVLLGPLAVAIFLSFMNFYRLEFADSLRRK